MERRKGGIQKMSDMYQFSDSYQKKVLALMARDRKTYISYNSVLKPMYFRKAIYVDLARIIQEHYEREIERAKLKGTKVCAPTIEVLWEEIRRLTGKNKAKAKLRQEYQDTALDLFEVNLDDSEHIKDSLIQFGKRSAIEKAILDSVDDIQKDITDFSIVEERITKAIHVGEDIEDLGTDYFENAEKRMEVYQQGTDGVRRIPTGMSGLDKCMGGGLGDTELGVIIAPPNRGKSFALVNIGAGAIMEGFNVAHYTLEMPEQQVTKRYDERLMNKNFDYLKSNTDKVLSALMNMQKLNKGKLIIKKFPVRGTTVNSIRAHLTKLEVEKNFTPDLVVVDYGDLIQPRRKYADKRFELESVYLDLRDLGAEYECPVWTASQANRDSLNKKVITMADLAEAFNKANIADFMAALCQTTEEKEDGVMRWHIAKQRSGQASITLDGDIDYETATMMVYDLN